MVDGRGIWKRKVSRSVSSAAYIKILNHEEKYLSPALDSTRCLTHDGGFSPEMASMAHINC